MNIYVYIYWPENQRNAKFTLELLSKAILWDSSWAVQLRVYLYSPVHCDITAYLMKPPLHWLIPKRGDQWDFYPAAHWGIPFTARAALTLLGYCKIPGQCYIQFNRVLADSVWPRKINPTIWILFSAVPLAQYSLTLADSQTNCLKTVKFVQKSIINL